MTGTANYDNATVVTLSATADNGSIFTGRRQPAGTGLCKMISKTYTANAYGKTFYYRVRAIKAGAVSSPYTNGNGCYVGP